MTRKQKIIFALSLNVITIALCIYWYDYKLAILIFLFNFIQNIENSSKN